MPVDLQKLADRLDAVVLAYGHGPLATRPTGPEGFLYYATDTKMAYYCTAPGAWQPVTPLDAGGDLAGTWPTPSIAKVTSNNVPLHTDAARRLIRETRSLPASALGVVELGSLAHQGATVAVTVAYLVAGGQKIARFELAVVPTTDTGWRSVAQSSAAGSGAAAVRIEAREVEGVLSLRVRETGTGTDRSVVATIDVEGRSSAWTPTAATGEPAAATNAWVGGPVALPIGGVLDWPATTAPSGPAEWLELVGQPISRTTWPELFAAWGIAGGTMNLPDRRGRTQIGAGTGPGLSARSVGVPGGFEKHALSPDEGSIREHQHHMETVDLGLRSAPLLIAGPGGKLYARGDADQPDGGASGIGFNSNRNMSAGWGVGGVFKGAQPGALHENMPPFLVSRYFVRAR